MIEFFKRKRQEFENSIPYQAWDMLRFWLEDPKIPAERQQQYDDIPKIMIAVLLYSFELLYPENRVKLRDPDPSTREHASQSIREHAESTLSGIQSQKGFEKIRYVQVDENFCIDSKGDLYTMGIAERIRGKEAILTLHQQREIKQFVQGRAT
jgi:hypothetical protein